MQANFKKNPTFFRSNDDFHSEEQIPSISIKSVSVSYNPSIAVSYARKFGGLPKDSSSQIFKPMYLDCTNFVSQCIWAGYGGTQSLNFNNLIQIRNLVDNRYRMTGVWYGLSRNASPTTAAYHWIRVLELWDYMTTSPSVGPRGTGYNNNKLWNLLNVSPKLGDVLQVQVTKGGPYRHSVIITKINSPNLTPNNGLIDNVFVTQHEASMVNRSLKNLIQNNGGGLDYCKMRLLRPKTAYFNN